jgi:hypothetical protein
MELQEQKGHALVLIQRMGLQRSANKEKSKLTFITIVSVYMTLLMIIPQ